MDLESILWSVEGKAYSESLFYGIVRILHMQNDDSTTFGTIMKLTEPYSSSHWPVMIMTYKFAHPFFRESEDISILEIAWDWTTNDFGYHSEPPALSYYGRLWITFSPG
jgi:hypothetical protein